MEVCQAIAAEFPSPSWRWCERDPGLRCTVTPTTLSGTPSAELEKLACHKTKS
jgi:hypothetical protein